MTEVSAVIPMKPLAQAKTRMALSPLTREAVVLAMFKDTLSAVGQSSNVVETYIVTRDPEISSIARRFGAKVVREHRLSSLNYALGLGRREAALDRPFNGIAMIAGDLPGLEAAELDSVIDELDVRQRPLLVPDHHHVGTSMLLHTYGHFPAISFGEGSLTAHERFGYQRVQHHVPSLQHDVDTLSDLANLLGTSSSAMHTRETCQLVLPARV
jgi:2-phospho-L-lactate guanylyltransferase